MRDGAATPQCLLDAEAFVDDDRAFVAIIVEPAGGVSTIASRARRRDVARVPQCSRYVTGAAPDKARVAFLIRGIHSVARNLRVGT